MQHWTIFSAALRKNRENIGVTAAAAAQKGQEKMARDEVLLTQEGYDKLVAEHEELVAVRRLEVAERLKAAKNEQAELEEKILKLETMIRNTKVIDESEITSDRVNLGHTVRVEYIGAGEVEEYTIVGSNESDPFEGRISNESAIGSALIGTSVNDEVTVEIPDGIIHLKVLEISRH